MCSMPGCSNNKRFTPEGISFHLREILENWLKAARKDVKTWTWSKNKFVCSAHFEDFTIKNNIKYLKKSAVPHNVNVEQEQRPIDPIPSTSEITFQDTQQSITSSTQSSSATTAEKPRILKRKYSKARKLKFTAAESSTSSGSSPKRRRIQYVKTFHNYALSPSNIKKQNVQLKTKQLTYREKLYSAHSKIKNLKRKVSSLAAIVDELKTKHYLSALPHQATIRKWYSNINCHPGFIEPAFNSLKTKVIEGNKSNREIVCSLIIDEVGIKKQIDFDGRKTWGYVDIGVSSDNENLEVATETFVVMVVVHQYHWKVPIAYFLIKSLTGKEKANIVLESLVRLHEIGIVTISITRDGPAANFGMLKALGCNMEDVHNMRTWFLHPGNNDEKVWCLLDACHMLKLARNHFANVQQFKDPQGNIINWNYIKMLHGLQEEETLNIANKLKKSHLEWYKQRMNVNLAAQTLSSSVANPLEFLDKSLHVEKFRDCDATVAFIRLIDQLFDVLNFRSPWARGFKAPVRLDNIDIWRPFLSESIQYLLCCRDVTGIPLWRTPKKTPFIGFTISIISIIGTFDQLVVPGRLNYLLSYKCSQDHLEIFFCMVRNGWNNNPTALQFMQTFRKLLLHANISGKGGNCQLLDTTSVLTAPSTSKSTHVDQSFDISLYRKYNIDPAECHPHDHDYDLIHQHIQISEVATQVVTYISGYIITMLKKSVKCPDCLEGCGKPIEEVENNSL